MFIICRRYYVARFFVFLFFLFLFFQNQLRHLSSPPKRSRLAIVAAERSGARRPWPVSQWGAAWLTDELLASPSVWPSWKVVMSAVICSRRCRRRFFFSFLRFSRQRLLLPFVWLISSHRPQLKKSERAVFFFFSKAPQSPPSVHLPKKNFFSHIFQLFVIMTVLIPLNHWRNWSYNHCLAEGSTRPTDNSNTQLSNQK